MPKSNTKSKLEKIESLVRAYHLALDKREHGGIAQDRLVKGVEHVLDMPWKQGEELAKSKNEKHLDNV
ncbi:MAG: hypothetical protein R3E13_01425 [Alphaproteobacteria bacterium]